MCDLCLLPVSTAARPRVACGYFATPMDPRTRELCSTNNRHFQKAPGVQVVTPAQLLEMLANDRR